MHDFRAPRWLPGGHAQTIWPVFFSRRFDGERPRFRRERWTTPDRDFVDVDWLGEDASVPLLVLFHGLEGSSRSHYAEAFAADARRRGWRYAVPHFRGCSGELNLAPRAYHSGDHEEVAWMLERFRALHGGPIIAVGISLGGNALLRFAEEAGESAARRVHAIAAVSAPLDLAAGGRAIGRGFGRQVYTRMFLRTMKKKALLKLHQHPGLFDARAIRAARDLRDFDDVFTSPLHGFANADDYYARSSAKDRLARIRIPALVLNARNDPFLPASALPRPGEVGPCVTLWQPSHGGHVGFAGGPWPGHLRRFPEAVAGWLAERL
jgi:predicted alpha/beta-fold hydrolase